MGDKVTSASGPSSVTGRFEVCLSSLHINGAIFGQFQRYKHVTASLDHQHARPVRRNGPLLAQMPSAALQHFVAKDVSETAHNRLKFLDSDACSQVVCKCKI